MIYLTEHKDLTAKKPIKTLPLPESVFIPLIQHTGAPCVEEVNIGDKVLVGQRIGSCSASICSPIHASLSGEVVSIRDYPHPSLGECRAIEIKSDGKDQSYRNQPSPKGGVPPLVAKSEVRNQDEVDRLTQDELINIIFEAGIVGLGGAAFPTHIKLRPPKPVEILIINLAECEPYLTCDYRVALENSIEILRGIQLLAKILGVKRTILAIEDNKSEVIKKIRANLAEQAFRRQLWQASYVKTKVEVVVLKTGYPQGGEKQLIQSILGREVPSGGLPFDVGVMVQNVGTVFAVYEAVYRNKPLYERVVTIAGEILSNPGNFKARIGTPVSELIQAAGPLKKEIAKVVIGGPMMGIAQYSLEVPVIKSTTGVIVFSKDEIHDRENRICCRCARCIEVCPARIMPAQIGMAVEKERWDIARNCDVFDCIECGLCSYVCPAKRDLVHLIKYAKSKLENK